MNQSKFFILFVLSIIFGFNSFSQTNCKVLIPEISEQYTGKCKKGLANGKGEAKGIDHYIGRFSKGFPDGNGTYTWANGDVYTGGWEKGKRQGVGIYTFKINERDTALDGLWESDFYKGPKPKKPSVTYSQNVKSYKFAKINDANNTIEIRLIRAGATNKAVSNFYINPSTGTENGYFIENINYPVKVSVRYTTVTTLETFTFPVTFDFEITDPGQWVVTINN